MYIDIVQEFFIQGRNRNYLCELCEMEAWACIRVIIIDIYVIVISRAREMYMRLRAEVNKCHHR